MPINTILLNDNHPKSVVKRLNNSESLPFSEILSAKCITKSFQHREYRERIFTPDITIWGFLSQVLNHDKSCQATVARIIAFFTRQGKAAPSANTAAYCKARTRLPEEALSSLSTGSAEQLELQAPSGWLWRNKHIKLIDGSTLFMPDTPENQAIYPQHKNQKMGLGFPIARIVGVISYATGAVFDLAVSGCFGKATGEHSLLRQILSVFKPGDIALGDCYYGSFFLIAKLIEMGVDIVFPIHNKRTHDFRKGIRLGKKDHITQWKKPQKPEWMSYEEYATFPEKISIREIEIQKERKGFKSQKRIIVTTFIDSKSVSRNELKILYDFRWSVEIDLRSIKDTMQMGILRGKTPEMVRKEIWMHILAYNLIRKIIAQAASEHDKNPREISFKFTLQLIEAFRLAGLFSESRKEVYKQLLKALVQRKIGNRGGRREPRCLKRRPKNYPLLMKPRPHYHKKVI